MKVNKAIYLSFNNVNQTSTNINVNFPVKSIHIKSACLTSINIIAPGDEVYFTLISDLCNSEPLAHIYNSSTYSANQFCDISFVPYKPIQVNGDYKFTLYRPTGIIATPASVDCLINLIIEFNGEDTIDH